MGVIFYLVNYVMASAIFILLICWIFYLAKAIKYSKSSCENYEAEIKNFKEKSFNGKNIYTYKYILEGIEYFGEIKTSETYNIGDKVSIAYKKYNRSESITQKDRSKLTGKILGFLVAWIIFNVLFVLCIYGQILFYDI